MSIKITHLGNIELKDYCYLVIGDKIFICNKEFGRFELSKKGDKIVLPVKYHIELLKLDTESKKLTNGILIKVVEG